MDDQKQGEDCQKIKIQEVNGVDYRYIADNLRHRSHSLEGTDARRTLQGRRKGENQLTEIELEYSTRAGVFLFSDLLMASHLGSSLNNRRAVTFCNRLSNVNLW